jgi:uncharacterized NAD-dependent epimerase/dehydratase family protein
MSHQRSPSAQDALFLRQSHVNDPGKPSAVVYCEGSFGSLDGKTANGLVRYSEKYRILAVIDSTKEGRDSGRVLDDSTNGIPICRDLADALLHSQNRPEFFIIGTAPAAGCLTAQERLLVLEAMEQGLNIVNGLHEFLTDDPVFAAACISGRVTIQDVRKPLPKNELRLFTGRINEVTCRKIAVMGTDCAIGKRTTAHVLTHALNACGIKAVMVGTGQTGLIQGAKYGVALDAVPSQFCTGELERKVLEAYDRENPDVIVIEGQGALSHPAYSTSSFILRGCCPDGVILQHAPMRTMRCDFENMEMPSPESEIKLIETFADTKVIGLTINHENMSEQQVNTCIEIYEEELGIPSADALLSPPQRLLDMIARAFPDLGILQGQLA